MTIKRNRKRCASGGRLPLRYGLLFGVWIVLSLVTGIGFAGPVAVTLDVIALDGDAATGTAGVLDLTVGSSTTPGFRIDTSGRVYFSATSSDAGRDGIWAGYGPPADVIVVDGQVLPLFEPTMEECNGVGPLCGQIFNTFPQFSLTQTGEVLLRTTREDINGTVVFLAGSQNDNLLPLLDSSGTVDFPYDAAIGLSTEAGEYLIDSFSGNLPFGLPNGGISDFAAALIGSAPPGIADPVTITDVFGTTASNFDVTFGFNQAGDRVFVGELSDASEALYFDPAGPGSPLLLARSGEEPPGIAGAAYLDLTTTPTVGRSGAAAITDLGDGFFSATWRFPDQPFNNSNLPRRAIWRFDSGGVPVLVVSEYLNPVYDGVFDTEEGPNMSFDNITQVRAAPNGDIYFYATGRPVDEFGIPDNSDERIGLWREVAGGPLEMVLRSSASDVPGTVLPGGEVFASLGISAYGFDSESHLIFTTADGLYAEDSGGTLHLMIEAGQLIEVAPADFRTVDRVRVNNLGLVGGVSESFRNGRTAFSVRFTNATYAVMRASFDDPCTTPAVMFGSPATEQPQGPSCPAGDLKVTEFLPVQAIEDAPRLVRQKNTVFKAKIESTFGTDQTVQIEISEEGNTIISEEVRVIANCTNIYYFPNVTASHLSGNCSNESVFNSDQSFQLDNAGSRFFKFKLDPGNLIAETIESNNLRNKIKTVVDVPKQFKIVYKSMTNLDEQNTNPPLQGLAESNSKDSIKYLKNFLPLPEANVTGQLIGNDFYILKMVSEPNQAKKEEQLEAEMRDYLKQLADKNNATVAVGLFRGGGFINGVADGAAAFSYTPTDGIRNKEVINIMTTARDGLNLDTAGFKIAHEVLHTYDWVNADKVNQGPGRHFLKDFDINGYFHQASRQNFKDAQNLMQASPDLGGFPIPKIVPHPESYEYMLDQFLGGEVDPPILHMRGWIESDGTVMDLPWMRDTGFVDLPLGLSAEYTVEFWDAGNGLLAQTGFGPALVEGAPVAPTTYFYNIDDVPGTARITIRHGSDMLVDKTISDNAPTVTIQYPLPGDSLAGGQMVTLDWDSSDLDGDPLFHNVLVSTDSGENWDLLAVDLVVKEWTLMVPDDPDSSSTLFKVIASDGINTGEDTSSVPTTPNFIYADGFE